MECTCNISRALTSVLKFGGGGGGGGGWVSVAHTTFPGFQRFYRGSSIGTMGGTQGRESVKVGGAILPPRVLACPSLSPRAR